MDMLLEARFAPCDIRKEREVIKEEIAMYLDQPQHQVQEELHSTLWPDHALRLLNTILGENMSSRLFQLIREDLGLAYSIYTSPSFFADTGDLVVSVGLDTENLPRALKLVSRELRRISQQAPTGGELERARDYVFGQLDLGQESTDNQMNWLGEQLLGYGDVLTVTQIKPRLSKVTRADVRNAAAEIFRS